MRKFWTLLTVFFRFSQPLRVDPSALDAPSPLNAAFELSSYLVHCRAFDATAPDDVTSEPAFIDAKAIKAPAAGVSATSAPSTDASAIKADEAPASEAPAINAMPKKTTTTTMTKLVVTTAAVII